MAKEKRSAADLDAELAALEAELAALEGKPKKARKPEPAKASAPAESAPAMPAGPVGEKKSRFALPKLGKKETASAPAPAPAAAPEPIERSFHALAPAPARAERYDASVWRQDGDAWVRAVPETRVPVVRRVLDEHGNVVREEAADARAVEDVSSVKAERGLGRLLRRK